MRLSHECFYTDNVFIRTMLLYRFPRGITQLYPYSLSAACQKAKPHWLIHFTNIINIGLTNFIICHMALHCKPLLYGNKQKKTVSMVWLFPIEAKRNWSNNFLSNTFYRNPLCYIHGVNDSGATNEHYCQQPPSRHRTAACL